MIDTYRITITKTHTVEGLTNRQWLEGGTEGVADGSSYGYTPQIPEIRRECWDIADLRVTELDVSAVIQSILKSSLPL